MAGDLQAERQDAFLYLLDKHIQEKMNDPVGDYLRAMIAKQGEKAQEKPLAVVAAPAPALPAPQPVSAPKQTTVADPYASAREYVFDCVRDGDEIDPDHIRDLTGLATQADINRLVCNCLQRSDCPKSSLPGKKPVIDPEKALDDARAIAVELDARYSVVGKPASKVKPGSRKWTQEQKDKQAQRMRDYHAGKAGTE